MSERDLSKKRGLSPVVYAYPNVFSKFYLFIMALAIIVNIFLVRNGYSHWSIYFLTASSVLMAALMIGIYSANKNTDKNKQLNKNMAESRRMIFEVQNKVFPNFRNTNADLENTSIEKIVLGPWNWLICIFIFWIFFKSAIYTSFNFYEPSKLIALILVSLLQLIVLSIAISGMIIVVYKKIKGDKE